MDFPTRRSFLTRSGLGFGGRVQGSMLTRETRRKVSELNAEQQDEYFRQGMVLAYGNELNEAGLGHERGT